MAIYIGPSSGGEIVSLKGKERFFSSNQVLLM